MRKISSYILVCLLAVLLIIPVAQAHVLQVNNGVSAIMHIEPDDNPKADKPTTVNFLFNSTSGGFSLNNYTTTLKLVEAGKTTFSGAIEPAFFGASAEGEVEAIFPASGVYEVVVSGIPKASTALPFTLTFPVRVTGGPATDNGNFSNGITVVILGALAIIIVGMVATRNIISGGRYKSTKNLK